MSDRSRTIIRNGIVFTGSGIVDPAAVVIRDRVIDAVIPGEPAAHPGGGDRVIDAGGRLVTPGWINAHTHIYSALARGIGLKDPPPANFVQILERIWWRLDRALDLDAIALSARLHALESLRAGVTTLFDHHASQRAVRGSLGALTRSLTEIGIRHSLCFEVSDRDGPDAAREGIEENVAFLSGLLSNSGGRDLARGLFGLHAAFTLSDATLARCAVHARALGAGFHVHVAEDAADTFRVVDRLIRAGILGERTICVHGVHLDRDDLGRLAATGSWLVHCPESNMNNAVGAARLDAAERASVRLALGTDGFTADLTREALVAHLLHNHTNGKPGQSGLIPSLLFHQNAALASEFFGLSLGVLRAGAAADVVLWDYRPPTPLTTANFWGHVLFGVVSARARDVWIDGRPVLDSGRIPGMDEEDLLARCRSAAERIWERF
jgi:putative selenium metabolism protein SsnA